MQTEKEVKTMKNKARAIYLRLPENLKTKVQDHANSRGLSVNTLMILMVEDYLTKRGTK